MRSRQLMLGLVLAMVACTASAKEPKKPTLRDSIQGKWGKTNHDFLFEVVGNQFSEFHASKPFTPINAGTVEFPPGKEYAVLKARTGHTFWIYPAGTNVIAVETFQPDGTLWEDGRVMYRVGAIQP